MSAALAHRSAELLRELVGYRTENPGSGEPALCRRLAEMLGERGADDVEVVEVPRGADTGAYVVARFGTPRLLVNAHVDTVPANTGYTRDPFDAEITADRVIGLGTADTKGAIAAILVALAEQRPRDVAVLFSGDEERGSTVMRAFLDSPRRDGVERAIVCEPTARRAGIRHRGVAAYRARFVGQGGHSSKADELPKPIVTLARLAVALDELGQGYADAGPADMRGLCTNVADLRGGVAFNVVPDAATLDVSFRPPPGFDHAAFAERLEAARAAIDPAITLESLVEHPPFSCGAPDVFSELLAGRVAELGPVDFWTEAALLSAAGIDAVVVGPGDIAQAHAADEFVALADLEWATELFCHVFSRTHAPS